MAGYLCISVRFLDHRFHGRTDGDDPEWPPSPLRLLEALVAASAGRWNERQRISRALPALQWLEAQPPPEIAAPIGIASELKCQHYVADNTADLLVPAWKRGDVAKQVKRTEKVVRPMHLAGDAVHYLYALPKAFRVRGYRRDDEPLQRPHRIFELRATDGSRFPYPHTKLVHIAGMVRHLAIEVMNASPPTGLGGEWVEGYIAGHVAADAPEHRQLSYLPLSSIGHPHVDPAVRRIMIVSPVGDDAWLDHVARHLAGRMLEPLRGDEFAGRDPPLLVPVQYDKVARHYTQRANAWASVTPVILPGHDDHKPNKTRKLIEKALAQSGIDQPCEFEWGAFSRFPKSLSAHKYDRQNRPTGYIRPDHLLTQTAVHLTLRFNKSAMVERGALWEQHAWAGEDGQVAHGLGSLSRLANCLFSRITEPPRRRIEPPAEGRNLEIRAFVTQKVPAHRPKCMTQKALRKRRERRHGPSRPLDRGGIPAKRSILLAGSSLAGH